MKILEDSDGVTIILDQSEKKRTLFYAMGISAVLKAAINEGCTSVFVNTKPDQYGNERVLLSLRKPMERSNQNTGGINGRENTQS